MAKTQKLEGVGETTQKIFNKLKRAKIEGVKVELIGTWVWVSGDTKTHIDTFKKIGLHYAPSKKKWYFTESKYNNKNRKQSMKTIRARYGSQELINTMQDTQLALGM